MTTPALSPADLAHVANCGHVCERYVIRCCYCGWPDLAADRRFVPYLASYPVRTVQGWLMCEVCLYRAQSDTLD